MANEITVSGSLSYLNQPQNISQQSLSVNSLSVNITGKNFASGSMSVPTTSGGTAIPLAGLATIGWAMFKNNDATNYIELLSAVSGTVFAKLFPGEFALLRVDPTITAPAALAHTAPAALEWLMLEI